MIKTISSLAVSISLGVAATASSVVAQEINYNPKPYEKVAVYKSAASGDQVVDLVVFYQPIYARKLGGFEAVKSRVDDMIDKANAIYTRSGAGVTLNLVGISEITGVEDDLPYTGEQDKFGNQYAQSAFSVAAGRILNSSGYYDDDGVYHDNYPEYLVYSRLGGDIAGYITDNRFVEEDRSIGTASVGGEFFSVSDVRSLSPNDAMSDHTLAHETGHNFGARHEIEDAPNNGEHPVEAHAWKCGDDERTVMWSSGSSLASVFSSPLIERNGEPCGVAGEADNVSVIQGTKQSVSERRNRPAALGNVIFSDSVFSGSEESGEAVIRIERDGDVSESASVLVQLTSDTATSNGDVHLSHKRVEFAAGESQAQFAFPVVQDAMDEGDETLNVELHYPHRLTVSADTATLTITDDYAGQPGSIEIEAQQVALGEDVQVTLNRVGGADGELVVNAQSKLAESSSIALPAWYFQLAAHNFVFADGETQKTFTVKTQTGDEELGDREILISTISGGDYESVSKAVIVGSSQSSNVEFTLRAADVTTDDSSVRITVNRSGDTSQTSSVAVTSSDGTLKAGTDYEAVNETVSFGVNDSSETFTVNLLSNNAGNFVLETSSGETLTVTVSSADTGGGSGGNGGNSGGTSGGSTGLLSVLILALLGIGRKLKVKQNV